MNIKPADMRNAKPIEANALKWNSNPRSPRLCAGIMTTSKYQNAATNGASTPKAHLSSQISSDDAYLSARIGTATKITGANSRKTNHSSACQSILNGVAKK